jgi:hypothetical protein
VHKNDELSKKKYRMQSDIGNRIAVCALVVSIVWLMATLIFVYSNTFMKANYWEVFVWAVPLSCMAILRSGRSWVPKFVKIFFFSVLVWMLLTSVYIQFLPYNFWLIFIIGVPAQLIIVLWYNIKANR